MQQPPGYPQQGPYRPAPPAPKPAGGIPVWVIILIAVGLFIVVLVSILVSVAYSGVNKYMAASRSAEAKHAVGAISRAAYTAYELESPTPDPGSGSSHRLCASAMPVPASIASVRGTKYMPSPASGADFNTGDASTGWRCLRFAMPDPMYYQYRYTQGSGYLVPSTAPGANGFEAAAQGDIDGDGVLSTFALTGEVGSDGVLKRSTAVFIENEPE